MSNWMAIAAVTDTLRALLTDGFASFSVPTSGNPNGVNIDVKFYTQPPDKVEVPESESALNIFLYHVTQNAGWRNSDLPSQTKPGETANPPLALNLYYLLSAYGKGSDHPDPISHHILGRAMSILHDTPLLSRDRIKNAMALSNLHLQIERIRITQQPFSIEELFNLWSAFQTQYRISVAYQVTVVLIESSRSTKTPPPVLGRNSNDDTFPIAPEVAAFPSIFAVNLPNNALNATGGSSLLVQGRNMSGTNPQVRFSNALLETSITVTPTASSATQMEVSIPVALDSWPAGYSSVAVLLERNGRSLTSNELPLAIAPAISLDKNAAAPGDLDLTITCSPAIQPEQRVALLFGDRELLAPERTLATTTLTFTIPDLVAGLYLVRLRVDGVDSQPYVRVGDRLEFDANQMVTIS